MDGLDPENELPIRRQNTSGVCVRACVGWASGLVAASAKHFRSAIIHAAIQSLIVATRFCRHGDIRDNNDDDDSCCIFTRETVMLLQSSTARSRIGLVVHQRKDRRTGRVMLGLR